MSRSYIEQTMRSALKAIDCLRLFMLSFENEDASLFRRCKLERVDGEPCICFGGDLQDFRLMPGVEGATSNAVVSLAIDSLRLNGFITINRLGALLRISRGPRANSLREGSGSKRGRI
jgi:hypothetical protein